jgi:hypothetical protein
MLYPWHAIQTGSDAPTTTNHCKETCSLSHACHLAGNMESSQESLLCTQKVKKAQTQIP